MIESNLARIKELVAYAAPPSTYPTPQYTDTTVIMSGYIEYQEGGAQVFVPIIFMY